MLLMGCDDTSFQRNNLTLGDFDGLRADEYALNSQNIRENLEHFCRADKDSAVADFHLRNYYRHHGRLFWVSRCGVDRRADTLLAVLHRELKPMGFTERSFAVQAIEDDLQRMRALSFDADHPINKVAARLEYHLSKAYFRYAFGQRFGFVSPQMVLNHLDPSKVDSTGRALSYVQLFDVDMDLPDDSFTDLLVSNTTPDSLSEFLEEIKPNDPVYNQLQRQLASALDTYQRKLMVNMERRRWRDKLRLQDPRQKHVLVNIAAFHLWAVAPDSVVDMRIACGALKTKTPLLSSNITHMQVNPEWSIPMSIIRNDVARHAGDPGYFARHRYYIADRSGKRVSPASVTSGQLASGNYRVAQEGGPGNALGSIIFRFKNNFSVFLHYTSNPGVFNSENRGVSHGCVRVQHPFELAKFLLGNSVDDWTLDKLRISMRLTPETERGKAYMANEANRENTRLISSLNLPQQVPVYLTYYTVYPNPATGQLQTFPDVYSYDKPIEKALKTYMK